LGRVRAHGRTAERRGVVSGHDRTGHHARFGSPHAVGRGVVNTKQTGLQGWRHDLNPSPLQAPIPTIQITNHVEHLAHRGIAQPQSHRTFNFGMDHHRIPGALNDGRQQLLQRHIGDIQIKARLGGLRGQLRHRNLYRRQQLALNRLALTLTALLHCLIQHRLNARQSARLRCRRSGPGAA